MSSPHIQFLSDEPDGGRKYLIGSYLWYAARSGGGWGLSVEHASQRPGVGPELFEAGFERRDDAEEALFANAGRMYFPDGEPVD